MKRHGDTLGVAASRETVALPASFEESLCPTFHRSDDYCLLAPLRPPLLSRFSDAGNRETDHAPSVSEKRRIRSRQQAINATNICIRYVVPFLNQKGPQVHVFLLLKRPRSRPVECRTATNAASSAASPRIAEGKQFFQLIKSAAEVFG